MRHHYLRYSLKTFLLVVTVASVYFGLQASRVAKQRQAVGIIQAAGGNVSYDFEFDSQLKSLRGPKRLRLPTPGPAWLHALIGKDYFRTVVSVGFFGTDAELLQSSNLLPNIRSLGLGGNRQVTDEGLRNLPNLEKLERLSLHGTNIGDNGMHFVGQCTALQNLQLTRTHVTDAGMRHLTRLWNLEKVGLSRTEVSDEGIEYLFKASPKKLRWLNLQHTNVTDVTIARLTSLPTLDFANVGDTGVSAEGVLKLREAFPSSGSLIDIARFSE